MIKRITINIISMMRTRAMSPCLQIRPSMTQRMRLFWEQRMTMMHGARKMRKPSAENTRRLRMSWWGVVRHTEPNGRTQLENKILGVRVCMV